MRRLLMIALLGVLASAAGSPKPPAVPLRLVQVIPLDGVEGRIDHMAADPDGQRLFIAALGSNTVEVVDLRAGKRIRSIGGFREPQGVSFVPLLNRLFVANARDGICEMLDGTSFHRLGSVRYSDDADNVRYDAAAKRIYVGYGGGALGVLDAQGGDRLESIPLKAHPESFQLEAVGERIFVNVPDADEIAVVDRYAARVVAEWRCDHHPANFPMALDEAGHCLFVGCRHPAAVLVYDTRSGQRTAAVPIHGDADDIFYDAARGRIYVSCGAGSLDVLARTRSEGFDRISSIPTARGARTSFYVPTRGRLYLAVPRRDTQRAELRVFEAER